MDNLVSIITPNYNSEKFISETIDSVIAQTYQNWEMIIIDDVSTDNSIDIIHKYIKNDTRIQLIRLSNNSGAAVARNKGIEKAKGKFIAFVDSDDLWSPFKLETQLKLMLKNNIAFSYSPYKLIDEDGKSLNKIKIPLAKIDYKELLKENQIGCLTAMYDQEILGKCYMPLIRKRQDYGLWLSILKKVQYGYSVTENLEIYRIRKNSISSNKVDLLKYNYELFHIHEELSYITSFYYLMCNIYRKIKN